MINKPPGVAVHGGFSVQGKTVVDFLLEKFPEIGVVGDEVRLRPGIVHRLDKDTSGVMVVARNQRSFDALKKIFQKREVEKIYKAIVCGRMKEKKGIINMPIGRIIKNPLKRGVEKGRKKIRGSREAITEYRVLNAGDKFSLVEIKPKTGRMHQIRVHMSAIAHPVACDKVYGGKNVCCPAGASSQLLHAQSISFSYPEGRKLYFEAEEPESFSSLIN